MVRSSPVEGAPPNGAAVLLSIALATVVVPAADAQTVTKMRMPGPLRDAGVYHLASGTWARGPAAHAAVGPDVIYRADAPTGYFGAGWEGSQGVDEGILPGTDDPLFPGPRDAYVIDGFAFAYCSASAAPVDWELTFYDSYYPCDDPDAPANCLNPVGAFALPGLPTGGCWTVTVDLSGGGEFCMVAAGGPCAPGYDGHSSYLDHFGWGATWNTTDGASAGPVLAGHNPWWVPEGEGTCYSPAFTNACGAPYATGLGALDLFGIGAPLSGCYFFGFFHCADCSGFCSYPAAQFHLLLYTDCSVAGACGDPCERKVFCDTNPDNAADLAVLNCVCAQGTLPLRLTGAPIHQATYLLIGAGTGTVTDPPGARGDLCLVSAPIGRYDKDVGTTSTSGTFTTDVLDAVSGGGGGGVPTIGGNLCSPAGQTWRFQYWHRDGMGPSRFSKGVEVTFQ